MSGVRSVPDNLADAIERKDKYARVEAAAECAECSTGMVRTLDLRHTSGTFICPDCERIASITLNIHSFGAFDDDPVEWDEDDLGEIREQLADV